ncbi:ALP1-like protein [Tanacetum coccineum]
MKMWEEFLRVHVAAAYVEQKRGDVANLVSKKWIRGACKLLVAGVVSSGWSFVSAVPGQMTYPIASLTLDSARSYVMQGAPFTKGTISSIPIGGNISPEGFLPSILLMVIMVTVVIVAVILVVVVVAIFGVVVIGCLGALDRTLVKVTPPSGEKSRYRTRKGCISTNVLGVCCPNMQFIYVLPGWEGSAHDGRVLRDAISRPQGLRVPNGLSSYKKKKAMTPQQVLDAKLDGLSSDFKSICGEMASKFGVVADALTLNANKSECVSEEKMQEVMNELINIGIYPLESRVQQVRHGLQ